MELHIVSGFLGSGKTTAIAAACNRLKTMGYRTAAVANDQGKTLVDSLYFSSAGVHSAAVTGGCFCCRYDDLLGAIESLVDEGPLDVVFAEAVGSCTDVVATVVNPLLRDLHASSRPASYSVFCDIQQIGQWLSGVGLPFSDEICYIFEKQLEEASMIVINKADLLPSDSAQRIAAMAQARFPAKHLLLQSSLAPTGVDNWISAIRSGRLPGPEPVAVDYERYGAGEARLAWYNGTITATAASDLAAVTETFVSALCDRIDERAFPIGHLKLQLLGFPRPIKLSFTATSEAREVTIPSPIGPEIVMVLNARIECDAEELRAMVQASLTDAVAVHPDLRWLVENEECFHPAFPRPTHRIA